MSASSPLTDDAVVAILRHLNDDHESDMLDICRALGGVEGATAATVTGVDTEGMSISVVAGSGTQPIRISWPGPITTRADVRTQVVELHRLATGRSGHS